LALGGLPGCEQRWRARRRRVVTLVLVAGALACSGAMIAPAQALAATDYLNLNGDDAYHTSVLVSKAGFAPGVDGVVVANGDDYMAATCSAVLAAVYDGPVLLTPAGSLDPRIRDEIWRLGPDHIFVVGTQSSVATSIAEAFPEIATAGGILMLCGMDGPDTATLVAEQVKAKVGRTEGVVLVSKESGSAPAACAVAASALAASKRWPMLFVPGSGALGAATAAVIAELQPTVAVQVQTQVDLGVAAQVVRLEGSNRYEVGVKIADYAASVGVGHAHMVVVAGSDDLSARGLSVGAYLARNQGIALLCGSEDVPQEIMGWIGGMSGDTNRVDFCGPLERARGRIQLLLDTVALPSGFGTVTLRQGLRGDKVMWLEQRLAELSYRPGPIDGFFDKRTRQAVIAFQKWEGMKRDGFIKGEAWWRLLASSRPVPRFTQQGKWIEIDKKKQLLLYCVDGVVERTLAVSTGSGRVGIITPSGTFRITRENTRERLRYKPLYLRRYGYLSIHGYPSVPVQPASHGCVRMTWKDMDEFHALIPVGTAVQIY
jgi:N-acetylmuramoyl-L-alanine amidase